MTGTVDVSQPGAFEAALFNPFAQEMRADPWPLCHELRRLDPVYESPFGVYIITSYDVALSVLRNPRFSADPRRAKGLGEFVQQGLPLSDRGFDDIMLFNDPPDHTRLRSLVNKAFTPRVVDALRPRIQQIVDGLIDACVDAGSLEAIDDFAYPLPVTVIGEMLGVPLEDRDKLKAWSRDIAPILDPFIPPQRLERVATAGLELVDYVDALIRDRRAHLGGDLLSELIRAEDAGEKLTSDELRATFVLLLIAGHETTQNLIGNSILALLKDADELERLKKDPSLIRSAVEELLRHDGPGAVQFRIALEDTLVRDKRVSEGQITVLLTGAINRDPAQFLDPDGLDLGREPNRHLAFSAGPHFCLGATLARAEAQIALRTLWNRLPHLALASDTPLWRETVTFRGLEALPLRF